MPAEIIKPTPENLIRAAKLLQEGQVIGMPTETVYGLAGMIFDECALTRIFSVKERPHFDPLIVHVTPPEQHKDLLTYLEDLDLIQVSLLSHEAQHRVQVLLSQFWPGPLTLVLPKSQRVPDLATSGLETIAIRMPRHSVAQALIRAVQSPLAAPSANRFGRISPTSAQDVFEELGDRIPLILEGGRCEIGLESTVLMITREGELKLLRPGGISQQQIEMTLGTSIKKSLGSPLKSEAPGLLETHYAPQKPLILLDPDQLKQTCLGKKKLGLLIQSGNPEKIRQRILDLLGNPSVEIIAFSLSKTGDMDEAARNLFSTLRALDQSDCELILAEPATQDQGLGYAINDRLRRASKKDLR